MKRRPARVLVWTIVLNVCLVQVLPPGLPAQTAASGKPGVPAVTGLPVKQGIETLERAGFRAKVLLGEAPAAGQASLSIYRQSPEAGQSATHGSEVTITIYAPAAPAPAAVTPARQPSAGRLSRVETLPFAAQAEELVDPTSGRLLLTVVDLAVPAGPIELRIERSFQVEPTYPGLLGSEWRLNWEKRLVRGDEAAAIQENVGVTVFWATDDAELFRSPLGETLEFHPNYAVSTRQDGAREFFDAAGRLIGRHEQNGNKVVLSYERGRLSRVEGPFGSFLQFATDQQGRLRAIESSSGATVRYHYGEAQPLTDGVAPPLGVQYTYHESGLLASIQHPQRGETKIAFDEQRRVTSRRWADGAEERYEFDDATGTVRHIDPLGRITTLVWNADRDQLAFVSGGDLKTLVEFDAEGRPRQVTGPTGQTAKMTYDRLGRVERVENSSQGATRLEYAGDSLQPAAAVKPDGRRHTFRRDGQGNLVGASAGDDELGRIAYYDNGLVKSIAGPGGAAVTMTYDARGNPATVTDAAGNTTQFEFDKHGNLLKTIDPLGHTTTQAFDEHGRVTQVVDATGAVTRYEYSPQGQMIKEIDPRGGVTRFEYDRRGRLEAETDPAGRTTRYAYHADGSLKSVTDAADNTTRLEFDAAEKMLRAVDPAGGVLSTRYDALGRLAGQSDTAGGAVRFERNDADRHVTAVDQDGNETKYQLDVLGRVVGVTDPTGATARIEYTSRGELASVTPSRGRAVALEYDGAENLVAVREGKRQVAAYEYDVLGRRTKAKYATGHEVTYRYDALGNLLSWKDNQGGSDSFEYDAAGRPIKITDAAGGVTHYKYDAAGNLLSTTNPLGHATQFTWNAAGELAGAASPTGDAARYEYNAAGLLARVVHPGGGVTSYYYDAAGSAVRTVDPLGREFRSTYNAAGRLIGTTDAKGQTTSYKYDAAGRLIEKRLADGKVVRYEYDRLGQLTAVDDGAFPVRYQYDQHGNRTAIEYPAIKRSLHYEYDDEDRLVKFVDSEGQATAYAYDEHDRLVSMTDAADRAIRFAYDASDRRTEVKYPNGVIGTWTYDSQDRAVKLRYVDAAGKTVAGWDYQYDADGNLIETVDAGGRTTRYKHDASGQLIEESVAGEATRYSYLPGGNRARRETAGEAVDYRYDKADQILTAGEETFKHDANGNLIERRGPQGTTRYEYNAEDRLIKVALPNGETVEYGYSPTGERIWRKDADGLTHYVTDGLHVLAELGEDLKSEASYSYGPGVDDALMMVRSDERYCYHPDRLGSVSRITGANGNPAASYEYDAFGRVKVASGGLQNELAFTARRFDPRTGLYYYRARFYDPALPRFLSADPLTGSTGDSRTLNRYVYVLNSPLRYTDALGLEPNDLTLRQELEVLEAIRLEADAVRQTGDVAPNSPFPPPSTNPTDIQARAAKQAGRVPESELPSAVKRAGRDVERLIRDTLPPDDLEFFDEQLRKKARGAQWGAPRRGQPSWRVPPPVGGGRPPSGGGIKGGGPKSGGKTTPSSLEVGGVKGVMRAAAAAGAIALTTHTLAALIEGEDPAELAMRALQGVVQYAGEVGSDFGWAARLGGGIYNPLGAAGFGAAYVFLKHVVVGGIVGIPTSFAGAISGSFRLGKAIGKHLRDALLEPPNLGPPAKLAANLDPEFIPQPTAVDIPPIGYEKAFGPPATPGGPVAVGIPLLDTAGDNNPATERERYEEEVARRAQQLDKQLAALERARYEADVASRATDLERRLSEAERQARIRAAQAEYNRQIEAYNRALQNYQNWSRQQQWIQFQQRMQQQQQWRPPQWNQPQPWHNHGVPRQPFYSDSSLQA